MLLGAEERLMRVLSDAALARSRDFDVRSGDVKPTGQHKVIPHKRKNDTSADDGTSAQK